MFFSSRSPSVSSVVLVLEPQKKPNHTQQPNNNTLPHNVALYLFQTTGQVTLFSRSLCCSGLQHTSFLRLTTVYFVIPPRFVFSGLLRNRKLLAHQAFFPDKQIFVVNCRIASANDFSTMTVLLPTFLHWSSTPQRSLLHTPKTFSPLFRHETLYMKRGWTYN